MGRTIPRVVKVMERSQHKLETALLTQAWLNRLVLINSFETSLTPDTRVKEKRRTEKKVSARRTAGKAGRTKTDGKVTGKARRATKTITRKATVRERRVGCQSNNSERQLTERDSV